MSNSRRLADIIQSDGDLELGGKVGVGTDNPAAALHVDGAGTWIRHTGTDGYVDIGNWYTGEGRVESDLPLKIRTGNVDSPITFSPGGTDIMSIDADGSVYINNATGDGFDGTSGLAIGGGAPAISFEPTSAANDHLLYIGTGNGIPGLKVWNSNVNYDRFIWEDTGNTWIIQPGIGNGKFIFDVAGFTGNRARTQMSVETDYMDFQALGLGSSRGDIVMQRQGNRVGIGTATTRDQATLTVKGGIAYGTVPEGGTHGVDPRSIIGWYTWSEGINANRTYIHLKTNLWGGLGGNTEYTMSMFEIKGYKYSPAAVSRGMVGFHNWSNALPGLAISNDTSWEIAQQPYISADGYVVLVVYIGGSYGGFTVDWHQLYPYPYRNSQVANIAYSTDASGAF